MAGRPASEIGVAAILAKSLEDNLPREQQPGMVLGHSTCQERWAGVHDGCILGEPSGNVSCAA